MGVSPRDFLAETFGTASTRRRALGYGVALGTALGLDGLARGAAQEATPTAPTAVQQTLDVVYGEVEGTPLLLDVFQPSARETPRPAVIIIHGGGFVGGDRTIGWEAATHMAEAGYIAFSIGYRLFDQVGGSNPWPAQLDDAQRAVRWVRANAATYGVDPERIGAYGHSSGGTLAAMLGVRETRDDSDAELAGISSRVTCVVTLAGSSDLSIPPPAVMATFEEQLNAGLFGGTPAEVP